MVCFSLTFPKVSSCLFFLTRLSGAANSSVLSCNWSTWQWARASSTRMRTPCSPASAQMSGHWSASFHSPATARETQTSTFWFLHHQRIAQTMRPHAPFNLFVCERQHAQKANNAAHQRRGRAASCDPPHEQLWLVGDRWAATMSCPQWQL